LRKRATDRSSDAASMPTPIVSKSNSAVEDVQTFRPTV
jgi:hypothetical protein